MIAITFLVLFLCFKSSTFLSFINKYGSAACNKLLDFLPLQKELIFSVVYQKFYMCMNKKKILLSLVVLLVVIQFFQIDKTTPAIIETETFEHIATPPPAVATALRSACYDCHSYETKHPWYNYVAPVSWWIKGHFTNGRKAMNFSTWGQESLEDQKHLLHECAEEIEEGHMPPKGYVRMHANADLDEATQADLIAWLNQASK